jgi:hypothetical protein
MTHDATDERRYDGRRDNRTAAGKRAKLGDYRGDRLLPFDLLDTMKLTSLG